MGRTTSARRLNSWRADGLWNGLLALAFAGLCLLTGASSQLEHLLYDSANQVTSPSPPADLVLVTFDEASLASLGPWPWSRELHARLIERLSAAGAQTIVYTPAFTEPQDDRGLAPVRKIRETLAQAGDGSVLAAELARLAAEAEAALDADTRLATAIQRAGNVLLASRYSSMGAATPLPSYVRRSTVPDPGSHAMPAFAGQHPIPLLGAAAAGVGHLYAPPDADGRVRQWPLLLRDDHAGVPSLALLAAQRSQHPGGNEVRFHDAPPGLRLGGLRIATDAAAVLRPRWHVSADDAPAFAVLSAASVLNGAAPASALQGKTVLVGETVGLLARAGGLQDERAVSPVELLAQALSSIRLGLGGVVPGWAAPVAGLAWLLVLLHVVLVVPRAPRAVGLGVGVSIGLTAVLAEWALLRYGGMWVALCLPALAVLAGTCVGVLWPAGRRGATGARPASAETAEADRMMGLALHGQGQLDMAFDRLRKVPASDALMDNLYRLAEDFERQGQPAKALAVYDHMRRHDPHYKDLRQRHQRARTQARRTQHAPDRPDSVLPVGTGAQALPGGASVAVAMLGRYQIEREIGKGAMGVVYQGRDPKIGRVVAVKTLALGHEFEGDALIDARMRFFREAETAGRLQHPNIVTIFDAGEEHDLAYIAMEFLPGRDLGHACHQGRLLPVPTVLSIGARVADALDYAHAHHVVHRDIKPANIMFDSATDTVKVTDFGIARITDSSKTRTGLVLGTPSFMSPEQLAGQKVDGRSDLYSLGVALFQLLTGTLPLRGASMTDLMHKIANVEAPDVRQLRPELPAAVASLLARALQKRPEARYPTGRHFAADVRQALAALADPAPALSAPKTVVYDAIRDATGQDMADFQETVMEPPAERAGVAPPHPGAP